MGFMALALIFTFTLRRQVTLAGGAGDGRDLPDQGGGTRLDCALGDGGDPRPVDRVVQLAALILPVP